MDTSGAFLTIFCPVTACEQVSTADSALLYLLGYILTVEQRLKLWIKRQYRSFEIFARRRTSIDHTVKHIAFFAQKYTAVLVVVVRAHIGGKPLCAAEFLTGKLPEILLHITYISS